jgi:hypothetical protein
VVSTGFAAAGILGAGLAVIVDAGCGDIGMAEPILDFGNVGVMFEGIDGGCRPPPVGRLPWKCTKLRPLGFAGTAESHDHGQPQRGY